MHLPSGVDRYRVGDALTYDRTDFNVKRRRDVSVVAIDGERVTFADGEIRDQMGSILMNRFGAKNPGIVFIPADLSLGKHWRIAFTPIRRRAARRRSTTGESRWWPSRM